MIQTVSILGSFIGMLIGVWGIARSFRKDMDDSRDKVFARFDTHKESVDKKLFLMQDLGNASFVRKDNCALQTGMFTKEFDRVNIKLDKLLENGKVK